MGIGWIIRARGLAPSIGAGGTIVVAVLCCLVFVSALLTFRSWPSGGGGRSEGALQLRVPEAKAAGRTEARPAPAAARSATPGPGRARRPARRTSRGVARPRPGARARFRSPAPAASSPRPAPSRPFSPAAAPVGAAQTPPAGGSNPVVVPPQLPAGGAEQTVTAVRGVVNDVTRPVPVPPVVQQPVDQALDTVQGAARTADGITGPLLP
jgi:hypothetical protein